jgi:sec-independent protein translocase protein TatB
LKIGFTELLVVFIVALFVIGPDKLPEYAKKLGEALAQFKKASDAMTKDIKESIVEPLEEAQKPLREAMEPLEELNNAVKGNMKEVQTSLSDIGKPKKASSKAQQAEEAEMPEQAAESAKAAKTEISQPAETSMDGEVSQEPEQEIAKAAAEDVSDEVLDRKEEGA